MKWTSIGAAALLLATWVAPASAQEAPPEARASEEAEQRLEELDLEVEEFGARWREEQRELREKAAEEARKAAEEGREHTMPALSMRPDYGPLVERLIGWADAASGEDRALYLTRAAQLGGLAEGSQGRAAFERLLRDHAQSPSWARLGRMLPSLERALGEEAAARALDTLARSPHADVRGHVALFRHRQAIESAARDSKEYAAARAAVLEAAEEAGDAALADELRGLVELREELGLGCTAPDIVGVDLDGVGFRLSDYKGKVVFLDFWGDW